MTNSIQLRFGVNIRGRDYVTAKQWGEFQREYVEPHWDGFTVTGAEGFWKGQREEVTILTRETDELADLEIARDIARAYAREFDQDSVQLLVTQCANEFVGAPALAIAA